MQLRWVMIESVWVEGGLGMAMVLICMQRQERDAVERIGGLQSQL
jgi:hypothetical protein